MVDFTKNQLQIYFHSIPRKEHVPNVEVLVELFPLMRVKLFQTQGLRFLKMLFVHFQVKFLDTARMIYLIFATKEN